jgi:hypothetical protein
VASWVLHGLGTKSTGGLRGGLLRCRWCPVLAYLAAHSITTAMSTDEFDEFLSKEVKARSLSANQALSYVFSAVAVSVAPICA